jgi:hypothetical protein
MLFSVTRKEGEWPTQDAMAAEDIDRLKYAT